jgi:hypothetical protein
MEFGDTVNKLWTNQEGYHMDLVVHSKCSDKFIPKIKGFRTNSLRAGIVLPVV